MEAAELEFTLMQKEIDKIKAAKSKIKAEIDEKTKAMVNQINAVTNVQYNEVIAEANLIETEITAQARADAARIKAEGDGYYLKKVAETEQKNASLVSLAITLEGDAEAKMLKGLKKKRKHLQIMERLGAVGSLTDNKNLVVYGDPGNSLMANLEAFKMVYGK